MMETELRRYAAVLWRRRWWVAVAAAACAAVAAAAPGGGPGRSFRSSADVLVSPTVTNPLAGPSRVDHAVDFDTERQVLGSPAVARLAAARLGGAGSPEALTEQVSTAVSPDTLVITVSFTAPSPAAAEAGAEAFAEAYLEYRTGEARGAIQTITDRTQAHKSDLTAQLAAAAAAMAANPPETAAHLEAQAARNTLKAEMSLLDKQLASYAAVEVDPGTVIRAAAPAVPVRPRRTPVPLAAAMGLLAGMAAAFVRDRFDGRLHHTFETRTVAGLPVLAAVPHRRRTERGTLIAGQNTPDAEAYQRLATNVVAAHGGGNGTVVVTSPSPGDGKTTVAANLAVALARSGRRTAVVSADLRRPTLQQFFALPDRRTVNDLLEGRATEDQVAGRCPAWPNLTVYPSRTGNGHPGEQLQSPAMTAFLDRLRQAHDYVIIDGPPVLPVADVLSLAAGTTTILVGRQHRTTEADLRDTAEQLDQVGARLAGTVISQTRTTRTSDGYYSYSAVGRTAARRRRRELAVVATAGAALVAVAGSAATFKLGLAGDLGWPGGGRSERSAAPAPLPGVPGETPTRPAGPVTSSTTTNTAPTTTTTILVAAPPATSPPVTAPPTTATTRPKATTSSTTTTTLPARITPASARASAEGVALTLEANPGADGLKRSVTLRLTSRFTDDRVLRAVRIDYGDGKVVEPGVDEWACGAAGAPNPYVLTAPTRPYRASGAFPVTVTVTTATCSPDDDDWGPEEQVEIRLTLNVP